MGYFSCRILAQSQVDRFPPDWNAWKMDDEDMDDEDDDDSGSGCPKDESGHSKPRSLSTPNIPVHILSAPLDYPKITNNQTSLRKFIFTFEPRSNSGLISYYILIQVFLNRC